VCGGSSVSVLAATSLLFSGGGVFVVRPEWVEIMLVCNCVMRMYMCECVVVAGTFLLESCSC